LGVSSSLPVLRTFRWVNGYVMINDFVIPNYSFPNLGKVPGGADGLLRQAGVPGGRMGYCIYHLLSPFTDPCGAEEQSLLKEHCINDKNESIKYINGWGVKPNTLQNMNNQYNQKSNKKLLFLCAV
ncbi:MAG: hypothetical protein ACD_2C00246G0001, partial [uncultured bacterium (gcode 4)]